MSEKPENSWRGAVIYQIYPRSFCEVRLGGKKWRGEGSLAGITAKLDYLADLGVDAIWLSPFYPSPMVDSGYDVSDYTAVDERYGNLQDFQILVEQAHERHIKIMIDLVPNHTSDQHPWFQASRQSRDNPKSDWYIWRDSGSGGEPPNNWASVFSMPNLRARQNGGMEDLDDEQPTPPISAWQYDDARGQFYLRTFAKEQPDLNWANPDVRAAFKDVMRTWLDRGVDGFRIDAANHLGKNPGLPDEKPDPDYNDGFENPYEQLQHSESANFQPRLHQYLQEIAATLDEKPYKNRDLQIIFEAYVSPDQRAQIDEINPRRAESFNFARMTAPWNAQDHAHMLEDYYANLPPETGGNHVSGNHDHPRLVSRLGKPAARTSAVINLMLPGKIIIYNGEEGGFQDVGIPPELAQDALGFRDPERTPMLWNSRQNAGFSGADPSNLWLPVDPAYKTRNLARQAKNPASFFCLYKAALALRHAHPALREGNYTPRLTNRAQVLAFSRESPEESFTILANFSGKSLTVRIKTDVPIHGHIILSSKMTPLPEELLSLEKGIPLAAREAIVIRRDAHAIR
jgi:alpha-glucosidase